MIEGQIKIEVSLFADDHVERFLKKPVFTIVKDNRRSLNRKVQKRKNRNDNNSYQVEVGIRKILRLNPYSHYITEEVPCLD